MLFLKEIASGMLNDEKNKFEEIIKEKLKKEFSKIYFIKKEKKWKN